MDSASELLSGWHCKPTSHRQNDAELCVAAHHSRVALGRFFGPATDGSYLISKLICELNSEMAQAADPLHRNKIAGKRPAMPQRVVCSDAGAEQRRCFDGAQSIRYRG